MYFLPKVLSVSLVLCTVALSLAEKGKLISVVKAQDGQFQVVNWGHPDAIVNASFNNVINKTGWSFLELVGSTDVPDEELAYAAGMVEGFATGDLILMQWKNTLAGMCAKPSNLCTKLAQFIANNSLYMAAQINKSAGLDPYWYHVNLFTTQLKGLLEGYNILGLEKLTYSDLLLMQIGGDLESLLSALSNQQGKKKNVEEEVQLKVIGAGKCSALVKLLPGNAELFVSHDTWDDYQGMLRVFKLYDLKFQTSKQNSAVIPGYRVSFSSYPGVLLSGDDFYMISSGLVTTETTFGNSNPALWQYVVPGTVFEGIRNVMANRLARSGKDWSEIFSRHNSGTYNNQWMVVDYKLFEKGQEQLKNGLLWVLEQLPGIITAGDQTDVLRNDSYWPSYNIPYYPNIFQESGFAELARQYGSWFTWNGTPRAQIYARNHSLVTDIQSMIKLMRYNNFKHDPLSRCNCTPPYSGENAISARSDLNPANGSYPFGALGHRSHGGTDNKVTSSSLMSTLSCVATSGPTHEQQPVFQWSTSGFQPRPLGHPDKWDFYPVSVDWASTPSST